MRHRYNSCVELLLENIAHEAFQVKVSKLIQVAWWISFYKLFLIKFTFAFTVNLNKNKYNYV